MVWRILWMTALATGCALVFVGCESKLSKSNYDKIAEGMTPEQVTEILGDPSEKDTGSMAVGDQRVSRGVYTWQDDDRKIIVTFANGKVVQKMQEGL